MNSSTSAPPRNSAHLERTRQQLQELDALLQQMLDLPIADAPTDGVVEGGSDEPAAMSAPGPDPFARTLDSMTKQSSAARMDAPETGAATPTFAPHLLVFPKPDVETPRPMHLENVGAGAANELEASAATVERPREATFGSRAVPGTRVRDQVEAAAATPAAPVSNVSVAAVSGLPRIELPRRVAETPPAPSTAEPPGRGLRWLVGVNDAFDGTVGRLGGLGEAATRSTGRNVVGWIGIISLVAAVALTIGGWLGWTW